MLSGFRKQPDKIVVAKAGQSTRKRKVCVGWSIISVTSIQDIRSGTRLRLAPSVVEPQAEVITMIHKTNFAFGDDELSDGEVARLAKFLRDTGADRLTRIEVDGPRKAAGKHDVLTAARLASISDRLSGLGMNPAIAVRPIDSMTVAKDDIVVTVTRSSSRRPKSSP